MTNRNVGQNRVVSNLISPNNSAWLLSKLDLTVVPMECIENCTYKYFFFSNPTCFVENPIMVVQDQGQLEIEDVIDHVEIVSESQHSELYSAEALHIITKCMKGYSDIYNKQNTNNMAIPLPVFGIENKKHHKGSEDETVWTVTVKLREQCPMKDIRIHAIQKSWDIPCNTDRLGVSLLYQKFPMQIKYDIRRFNVVGKQSGLEYTFNVPVTDGSGIVGMFFKFRCEPRSIAQGVKINHEHQDFCQNQEDTNEICVVGSTSKISVVSTPRILRSTVLSPQHFGTSATKIPFGYMFVPLSEELYTNNGASSEFFNIAVKTEFEHDTHVFMNGYAIEQSFTFDQ